MRRNQTRSRGGFTLLELLLATAVGAIVLLVIQTTFFGALRLHNSAHARMEDDLELARALTLIRRDLTGLVIPVTDGLAGQLQTTNFSSSTGDLGGDRIGPDLYTSSGAVDGWNPFSEVQRITYTLTNGSGGSKDLVRVVQRNLLPLQDSAGDPQVLLHGVQTASIQFYDGTGWTDTWDSEETSTLPSGLKLSLVRDGNPADAPIEVIVPVLVTTTTSAAAAAEAAP